MRSRLEAVRMVLREGPRSQRGSVLSGVLIITAFIAIISGAVMTELSTNLILSRDMMRRAGIEATVNSAMAVAFDQLQGTPLVNGCPALTSISLNGQSAGVAYQACAPVVDSRSPLYERFGSSGQFYSDGAHIVVPRAGLNLYMVGDNAGNIYQYDVGAASPRWGVGLGGSVTGKPLSMPDVLGDWDDTSNLVPLTQTASSPPQCQAGGCAALLLQENLNYPDTTCYMPAHGAVTGQPGQGINNPTAAFFADQAGYVYAYTATRSGACTLQDVMTVPGAQAVIDGPLVFPGPTSGSSTTDQLYVLTSDGSSSHVYGFTYTTSSSQLPDLDLNTSVTLAAPNAVGFVEDNAALPARLAVTFAGGTVELVQANANRSLSAGASGSIPSGISDSPAWCCGGAPTTLAVAQTNGLYVLDAGLNLIGYHAVSGTTLSTSPAADAAGDWFVAAYNGNVYELPAVSATQAFIPLGGGLMGELHSGAVVTDCPAGLCVYTGSRDSGNYLLSLDARDVVMIACVTSSPPSCSGVNPRLWAQVEIGAAGSPQTVHIRGWSYFSS